MTTKELIEQLKTLPPDLQVVTEGYEEGYDTIKKVKLLQVEENPTKQWFKGKYTDTDDNKGQQVVFLFADTKADNK